MKITKIANISCGQDGAIYGSTLFRFDKWGVCNVYKILENKGEITVEAEPFSSFTLDRASEIVPHSNAVCFSNKFYCEGDEYPLLYSNIYNNYAKQENKLIGVCLVYRILKTNNEFKSTLVQMIEIGFTEDTSLWKAYEDKHGVRPYGNFVVDSDTNSYWAFTMRNESLGTRYFKFNLPNVDSGEVDKTFKVKKVVLNSEDILDSFDVEYHRYIQGAICKNGKIYSTEGFNSDEINRPAVRIINLKDKTQEKYIDILNLGFLEEPEFIDFYKDICLYSDYEGNLYKIEF